MRTIVVCTLLLAALGCGIGDASKSVAPAGGGGKLTDDERERWEKVRAKWKEDVDRTKRSLFEDHQAKLKGATPAEIAALNKEYAAEQKQHLAEHYHLVALRRGKWQTARQTDGQVEWVEGLPVNRISEGMQLGWHSLTIADAKEKAGEYTKNPVTDVVAVVDFFNGPDPKIVHLTRDRPDERASLAAYLLSKSVGR